MASPLPPKVGAATEGAPGQDIEAVVAASPFALAQAAASQAAVPAVAGGAREGGAGEPFEADCIRPSASAPAGRIQLSAAPFSVAPAAAAAWPAAGAQENRSPTLGSGPLTLAPSAPLEATGPQPAAGQPEAAAEPPPGGSLWSASSAATHADIPVAGEEERLVMELPFQAHYGKVRRRRCLAPLKGSYVPRADLRWQQGGRWPPVGAARCAREEAGAWCGPARHAGRPRWDAPPGHLLPTEPSASLLGRRGACTPATAPMPPCICPPTCTQPRSLASRPHAVCCLQGLLLWLPCQIVLVCFSLYIWGVFGAPRCCPPLLHHHRCPGARPPLSARLLPIACTDEHGIGAAAGVCCQRACSNMLPAFSRAPALSRRCSPLPRCRLAWPSLRQHLGCALLPAGSERDGRLQARRSRELLQPPAGLSLAPGLACAVQALRAAAVAGPACSSAAWHTRPLLQVFSPHAGSGGTTAANTPTMRRWCSPAWPPRCAC